MNLLKNIGHLIAGSFARSIIMVLFTVYIIRAMSVQDFGIYSTILAFSTITTAFVNFGLDTYLTREASKNKEVFVPLIRAVTKARFLLFVLSEVLLYSLLTILGYSKEVIYLTLLFAFDPLLCFLLDSIYSLLYIEGRTHPVALAEFGKRALLFLLVIFTARVGLFWIVLSYIIADGIILALLFLDYKRIIENYSGERNVPLSYILRKSFPFSIQTLTGLFFWNVDIMMVSKLLGPVATGLYNVGATIFKAIYFIPQAFASVLFPKISASYHEGNIRKLRGPILESTKNLLLIAIGIVLYSQTSLPYYIPLLFGDKYSPAMKLMAPMSLIVLFYFPAFIGQNILMAIDRENLAVNSLLFANVSNFVLNIILIERFGVIGAVYGTVISQVVFLGTTMYYLRDVLPDILPPLELMGSLATGTIAWIVTALAVTWLGKYIGPEWADNFYFVTLFLLYKTKIIKVEGFKVLD